MVAKIILFFIELKLNWIKYLFLRKNHLARFENLAR